MSQRKSVQLYWLRSHPLLLFLGLLCVLFLCLISLEFLLLGRVPDLDSEPRSKAQTFALLNGTGMHYARSQFDSIIQRPMFYEGRAPINQVVASSGALSDWVLTGVVITSEEKYALLENPQRISNKQANAYQRLKLKARLADTDWAVQSIEPGLVVLQRGTAQESLRLEEKRQPVQQDSRTRRK